ncbi:MAG: hypothetical protein IPJ65_25530 [Archangiaceae bacterium]|nr:hypothetical protein [Archangiaceae bacterium]
MSAVRGAIDELLSRPSGLTTREVAELAGVSRQAAQKQLKARVAQGELRVEGRARAARYYLKPKGPDLWAKVQALADALSGLTPPAASALQPQARLSRAQTVEVASAGSQYRLSARLLLQDVDCDLLTLDFNGVYELGDEFVEEVFEKWAKAHPATTLLTVNVDQALAAKLPCAP